MKLVSEQKNVGGLQGFIYGLVAVILLVGIGFVVLEEFKDSTTANSTANNQTGTLITKFGTVVTWIGILIVVAMAALVMRYFGLFGGGRQ